MYCYHYSGCRDHCFANPPGFLWLENLPFRRHKTQYPDLLFRPNPPTKCHFLPLGRARTCSTRVFPLFILLNHMAVRETDDAWNTQTWCFPVQFPTQLGFISYVRHRLKDNLSWTQFSIKLWETGKRTMGQQQSVCHRCRHNLFPALPINTSANDAMFNQCLSTGLCTNNWMDFNESWEDADPKKRDVSRNLKYLFDDGTRRQNTASSTMGTRNGLQCNTHWS